MGQGTGSYTTIKYNQCTKRSQSEGLSRWLMVLLTVTVYPWSFQKISEKMGLDNLIIIGGSNMSSIVAPLDSMLREPGHPYQLIDCTKPGLKCDEEGVSFIRKTLDGVNISEKDVIVIEMVSNSMMVETGQYLQKTKVGSKTTYHWCKPRVLNYQSDTREAGLCFEILGLFPQLVGIVALPPFVRYLVSPCCSSKTHFFNWTEFAEKYVGRCHDFFKQMTCEIGKTFKNLRPVTYELATGSSQVVSGASQILKGWIGPDGVHYNDRGNTIIAEKALEAILAIATKADRWTKRNSLSKKRRITASDESPSQREPAGPSTGGGGGSRPRGTKRKLPDDTYQGLMQPTGPGASRPQLANHSPSLRVPAGPSTRGGGGSGPRGTKMKPSVDTTQGLRQPTGPRASRPLLANKHDKARPEKNTKGCLRQSTVPRDLRLSLALKQEDKEERHRVRCWVEGRAGGWVTAGGSSIQWCSKPIYEKPDMEQRLGRRIVIKEVDKQSESEKKRVTFDLRNHL